MITISTDKPIEVDISDFKGCTKSICFMPSGSQLSFFDGSVFSIVPCPDFISAKFKSKKK